MKASSLKIIQSLLKSFSAEGLYPVDHKFAMIVPKGGSSCAKCMFGSEDGKNCSNKYFQKWNNGSSKLPAPADEYCCDVFKAKK